MSDMKERLADSVRKKMAEYLADGTIKPNPQSKPRLEALSSKPEPKPKFIRFKPGTRAWKPGRKIPHQDMDVAYEIKFCLVHVERLRDWEVNFVWSLSKQFEVPHLERTKLGIIYRRILYRNL